MNYSELHFTRLKYEDGNVESICRQCFATVARARSADEVEKLEHEHHCASQEPETPIPSRGSPPRA